MVHTMLSRSVTEYLSRVSKPLICDRIVLSSDSFRFCFICSFSSSDNLSFFPFSWFSIFSSQRRAFTFRSLAPPDITPDFWKSVPSNDTDCNRQLTTVYTAQYSHGHRSPDKKKSPTFLSKIADNVSKKCTFNNPNSPWTSRIKNE